MPKKIRPPEVTHDSSLSDRTVLELIDIVKKEIKLVCAAAAEAQLNKSRRVRLTKRQRFVPNTRTDDRELLLFDAMADSLAVTALDALAAIRIKIVVDATASQDYPSPYDRPPKGSFSADSSLFS